MSDRPSLHSQESLAGRFADGLSTSLSSTFTAANDAVSAAAATANEAVMGTPPPPSGESQAAESSRLEKCCGEKLSRPVARLPGGKLPPLPTAGRSLDSDATTSGDFELTNPTWSRGGSNGKVSPTKNGKSKSQFAADFDDSTADEFSVSPAPSPSGKVRIAYVVGALLVTLIIATIAAMTSGDVAGGSNGDIAGACLFGSCSSSSDDSSDNSPAIAETVPSPTGRPSLKSSPSPSLSPTTMDTSTVVISLAIGAAAAPTAVEEASLKATVASEVGVSEDAVRDFTVAVSRRRLGRIHSPAAGEQQHDEAQELRPRQLAVTWGVSFSIVASLADVSGASTPSAFASILGTTFASASFVSSVAVAIPSAAVDTSSVAAVAATRNPSAPPTSEPSPRPTAVPVPAPSSAPVLLPTTLPLPAPTGTLGTPTHAPRPLPTALPFPVPSAGPNPIPTPVPRHTYALKFSSQAAPAANSDYEIEVDLRSASVSGFYVMSAWVMHTADFNGTESVMRANWYTSSGTAFQWPSGGWPSQADTWEHVELRLNCNGNIPGFVKWYVGNPNAATAGEFYVTNLQITGPDGETYIEDGDFAGGLHMSEYSAYVSNVDSISIVRVDGWAVPTALPTELPTTTPAPSTSTDPTVAPNPVPSTSPVLDPTSSPSETPKPTPAPTPQRPANYVALSALYAATNGAGWASKANWMTGSEPCEASWENVVCDGSTNTKVYSVDLQSMNLQGTLPTGS